MKSQQSHLEVSELKPRILVVGVGGAGGNAVNNMIRSKLEGVEFVVMNTDAQSLQQSLAPTKLQLGLGITQGLGAGSKPDVGKSAAEESIDDLMGPFSGCNMVFITAGMGGGTGTGAAPVVARAARELGILTIGVVTKPFQFEGAHRMRMAEAGIAELQQYVDTLIVIPNQNLFRIANERTTFADAFKMADDVLYSGVRGITDLMIMPGLINLDFADVRAVMGEKGKAMMGTGEADGDTRALQAAESAISNPLLDDVSMKGARGVLISITGGYDMTLYEVDEAANRIREEVDPDANIIFGSTFDEKLTGKVRVSIVATGIDAILPAHATSPLKANTPGKEPHLIVVDPHHTHMTANDPHMGVAAELDESLLQRNTENDDFFTSHETAEGEHLDSSFSSSEEMETEDSAPLTLEKEKKLSLFQRLTGVHRRAQQGRVQVEETAPYPEQSRDFSHATFSDRSEDDIEDLEIPAFLRRQDHK
jgi:cell division protein FtsZ